jgi:hypothetical protein
MTNGLRARRTLPLPVVFVALLSVSGPIAIPALAGPMAGPILLPDQSSRPLRRHFPHHPCRPDPQPCRRLWPNCLCSSPFPHSP